MTTNKMTPNKEKLMQLIINDSEENPKVIPLLVEYLKELGLNPPSAKEEVK